MIQAEIGGAARIDPGADVQRPGFMIRDFALPSSRGEAVRGRSNLLVVFSGYSDAMLVFLENAARQAKGVSEQDTTVVVVVPYGAEERGEIAEHSSIVVLHDKAHAAYRLSGDADENGRPVPLAYLTDRFGEIVAAYSARRHSMPPSVEVILNALEFVNHQCPSVNRLSGFCSTRPGIFWKP